MPSKKTPRPAPRKTKLPGTPAPLAPAPKREYPRGAAPAPLPQKPARTAEEKRTRRPAPLPKTTKKAPSRMTPQDAAMKRILEKKYGKIYG